MIWRAIYASITLLLPATAEIGFQYQPTSTVSDPLPFQPDHPQSYLYYSGFSAGAICLGDLTGDGLVDVYFSRGAEKNHLFENLGDWKFQKSTANLGGEKTWGTGATLVDLDSDGDLDICQLNFDSPIQVFLNDGKGNFTEVPGAFGLNITDASLALSFADADNDGDLDAFLLCNAYERPGGRPKDPPIVMKDGKPVTKPGFEKYYQVRKAFGGNEWKMDSYGRADYFFLNVGTREKPQFQRAGKESGLRQQGFGLSCIWFDYNQDGLIDLYVANDFLEPDRLFHNLGVKDGIPRFKDVAGSIFPTTSWSSMGSNIADINHDGRPDLLTVDMSARTHFKAKVNMGKMEGERLWIMKNGWPRQVMRNHFFINQSPGLFTEEAWMRGIASTDWSWAVKFADFDEDGHQDVFVTNGSSRNFTDSDVGDQLGNLDLAQVGRTMWDIYKNTDPMKENNLLFHGNPTGRFEEVGKDWKLDHLGISYGAATGDLDGDGDLDLVVTDLGQPLRFYENQTSHNSTRLRINLIGTDSNRMGIGAQVTVTDDSGLKHTRWMMPWLGFQSQDDTTLHFGLGGKKATRIEVTWPGGHLQTLAPDPAKSELTITEKRSGKKANTKPNYLLNAFVPGWQHKDKPFDDFALQPLLPGKLSHEGPCIAIGDLNGDGKQDAYLGGAAGQPGELLVNFGGQLKIANAQWGPEHASEDTAALWFDADGDGDDDLYVVSGSVEHPLNSEHYRDRLYLNLSQGEKLDLKSSPTALPDLRDNGSTVSAADYDGDGDLDLFVGSRSIPGQYPLTPKSRLLRNDTADGKVKFTEATPPALQACGLVTDSTWADLDGDQDPDLLITCEWGPLRIFWNEKGTLTEKPNATLSQKTGWWQALHTGDYDGDGDLDILVGNVGWNTKYGKPSTKKPAQLYYGDMDGQGTVRLIEAKNSGGSLLPVRGRSCSTAAIPALNHRIKSFRQFASRDLYGIYGDKCLGDALHLQANEFASGMWTNDGKGNFTWSELPWEAQVSQVNAFAWGDLDGDGKKELILAQNEDHREPETGLWRGSLGVILHFEKGKWHPLPTAKTGLQFRSPVKALQLIDTDNDKKQEILAGQTNAHLLHIKAK